LSDPVSFHSQLAKSWSSKYRHGAFRARMQTFARAIEEVSAPGQHWLDAGCGTGELAEMLQTLGRVVSAVDASPEMVRHCTVPSTVAKVENLPFANETFDGIVCSSVLEYTESPGLVLQEFHRVLKPNASLLVSVPNSRSALRALQRLSHSVLRLPRYMQYSRHAFTSDEFDELLSRQGFLPRKTECFGTTILTGRHLPFSYALRLHVASKK
jgi:ubiquinone/menaquinone biosynthesis C-methylase UbiE